VLRSEVEGVFVEDVTFGGPAAAAGVDFDWQILSVELPQNQANAYLVYLPTGLVLGGVWFAQRRRREK